MNSERLLGESNAFLEVLEQVSRLAQIPRPVLLIGERGTGKELFAHRLHYLSSRWQHPFISINCAALSETLLETELFGHEAGSFTGAQKRHQGRFERADGGTLFLDEVATMSSRLQEKLLRVIEYGDFERVGGQQSLRVDVRLVCATHADLPALAASGQFRADLLDRLAFDVITLPPLRARRDDILVLGHHFAEQLSQELGLPSFAGFTPETEAQLLAHSWPGNVRELRNVADRCVLGIEGGAPPFGAAPDERPLPLAQAVEAFERALISDALQRNGGSLTRSAEALGVAKTTLHDKIRKYALADTASS